MRRLVGLCCLWIAAAAAEPLLPLSTTDGVSPTFAGLERQLTVATGEGDTTDGDGSLHLSAITEQTDGNHYVGIRIALPQPTDLSRVQLVVDARTNEPENTQAFYVRAFNQGENQAALSFNSWSGELGTEWRTFHLQAGLSLDGLAWEGSVVEDREAIRIDRLEFIIGSSEKGVPVDLMIDNLRTEPRVPSLTEIETPKALVRETKLIEGGQAQATILHPDEPAAAAAAARIAEGIKAATGVELPVRPATAGDRQPAETVILLGNVQNNPAMLLLYSRMLTPCDAVCPGAGGALVQTVHDPFGKGVNAVVVGASDEAGLDAAAALFLEQVGFVAQQGELVLPKTFVPAYGEEFLRRFGWADDAERPNRVEEGLAGGQKALDEGQHTSIAGHLRTVGQRYQLTGHSAEARLFVELWRKYEASAVADPRKFGGPWGFDSDFPSFQVVAAWDNIEEDPSLSDEDRLYVSKVMARWLAEAVVPKCAGAVKSDRVPFNHQTFPALGALMAGLYYTQAYDTIESRTWLEMADAIFTRQQTYYKPNEDCNSYQWLTNGHMLRYCVVRPDFTVFTNGNGQKLVDYCIGTMDNLGYQVPYGDISSWQCSNAEMICLDIFGFATGDPTARWAANLKREVKNTAAVYDFYQLEAGEKPDRFNGVWSFPVEPAYYTTFRDENAPPLEQCFDKLSFREAMDPQATYLLLDGLSNGGHKHLDGNSLERLTRFDRIWLADNDYFKTQVKYHNSLLIFKDGQATPIPEYAELMGHGETPKYGYSRSRMRGYSGVDWDRTVVWLKATQSFVVLDRVVAQEPDEYQLRVLWHGVGEPTLTDQGMLLEQDGPSMWVQTAPGPRLKLVNDEELGANWRGYPHAEPVVRSLSGIAQVRLNAGESYVFASALHGQAEGKAEPWRLSHLGIGEGVLVTAGDEQFAIGLGPVNVETPDGEFSSDAQVMVVDQDGVSLLGVTEAELNGMQLGGNAAPQDIDYPWPDAATALDMVPLRPPTPNLETAADAPAHPEKWTVRPQPENLILSANKGVAGAADLGVKLTSEPLPAAHNVFNEEAPNQPEQLLDGDWTNNTNTSVMYEPDQTVVLTVDLGQPAELSAVKWHQWWATSSSKNTKYLLGEAKVEVSNDAFANDVRPLGVMTDAGPHPNFGLPLEYTVDAAGAEARYVRWTIAPQPGAAVYLSEVLVEGKPRGDVQGVPIDVTRVIAASDGEQRVVVLGTEQGAVTVLNSDGSRRWQVPFGARINDLAAADVDGDGKDEIAVGRQDFQLTLLDDDGHELWSRELKFFRRPPYVNVVRTGDIDGDGRPEIVAGGENWRFYAFQADGTEMWNYESVHPSRSGAVADLDGDGKAEVLCGTHYYTMFALNQDGTRRWAHRIGPICYDVETGSFGDGQTRGVVLGGGDGFLHYLDSEGQVRLKYNTGDEVREVATGDLDGDGIDEVLGASLNFNLYCFGADAERRWRQDLGDAITALIAVPSGDRAVAVAGTSAGKLFSFAADGKPLAVSDLGAEIVDLAAVDGDIVVATADGRIRRLAVAP